MRVREAISAAAGRLQCISESPRLDAELIVAHARGITREAMLLYGLDDQAPGDWEPLVARRSAGEPVAYITGTRDFWSLRLAVTPAVLIPRPDSETLIEAAVALFADRAPLRVLDLGTGSGALLLAALHQWPGATGIGIDSSAEALEVARANADALALASRATFELCNWADGIDERFDLILCNPPYVKTAAVLPRDVAGFEPPAALFAGADGLDAYRLLAPQVSRLLTPGGIACIELGAGQAGAVKALFAAWGVQTGLVRDLAGRNRCLTVAS